MQRLRQNRHQHTVVLKWTPTTHHYTQRTIYFLKQSHFLHCDLMSKKEDQNIWQKGLIMTWQTIRMLCVTVAFCLQWAIQTRLSKLLMGPVRVIMPYWWYIWEEKTLAYIRLSEEWCDIYCNIVGSCIETYAVCPKQQLI